MLSHSVCVSELASNTPSCALSLFSWLKKRLLGRQGAAQHCTWLPISYTLVCTSVYFMFKHMLRTVQRTETAQVCNASGLPLLSGILSTSTLAFGLAPRSSQTECDTDSLCTSMGDTSKFASVILPAPSLAGMMGTAASASVQLLQWHWQTVSNTAK